jgi:ribosome biogenesis GTPase / thiamine phosphate phosphatase
LIEQNKINLEDLGWNDFFSGEFESLRIPDAVPGRVVLIEKDLCQVLTASGEMSAQLSGRMRYLASGAEEYPAIGDWLAVQPLPGETKVVIQAILPRKSKFSRQSSDWAGRRDGGKTREQVVAANVDTVFLVNGLDGGRGFNVRRIERYLAIAWSSGAAPVVVLNKADLCPDIDYYIRETEKVAYAIPIHAVSATVKTGLENLKEYLVKGSTVAFLGSSGVGKSALINALLGEDRLATAEVRKSDKEGRHTTTRRELILLPGGGAVIDTPGMRELQVWTDEASLDNAFEDISALAANCRFSDCRHDQEPGCAVREALGSGALDVKHFKSYLQLQKELHHQLARQEGKAALVEKLRWKQISKLQKQLKRNRGEA